MKRTGLILTVLLLSVFAAEGADAAPKPPKALCAVDSSGDTLSMSIKQFKKIRTSTGKMKIYAIHGEWTDTSRSLSVPIVGSGHMKGEIFHFHFTATVVHAGTVLPYAFKGTWNVATETGEYSFYVTYSGITGEQVLNLPLSSLDCGSVVIF